MNRRILSAIIAVLGLLAIVLAVCSATVWRQRDREGDSRRITHPELCRHTAWRPQPGRLQGHRHGDADSGEDVFPRRGHSADVNAWLANDPYVSVTGMESWEKLSATDVTTRCGDDPAAAPSASGDPMPLLGRRPPRVLTRTAAPFWKRPMPTRPRPTCGRTP